MKLILVSDLSPKISNIVMYWLNVSVNNISNILH